MSVTQMGECHSKLLQNKFLPHIETSQPSTKSYFRNHWNINDTEEKTGCGGVGELHLPDFSKSEKAIPSFRVLQ